MTDPATQLPRRLPDLEPRTASEPPYRVILHNDEITPMDFVTHVLQTVFNLPGVNAVMIMYTAHHNGEAYVQTLPRNEAQRRISEGHFAARLAGYPLQFSMEPV